MLKILLTYPESLPHETLLLKNLMQEDWDFLHVRKPDYSKDELENFLDMIPELHHKIVLHSHYELIKSYDLAGVNLTSKALTRLSFQDELTSSCDVRELTVKNGKVFVYGEQPDLLTASMHSFKEVQDLTFKTDYVFLSPIFDSISKLGHHSAFEDKEILAAFLKNTSRRVVALGGIDNTKINSCAELGFDGYAVLGNIWKKYLTFVETIQ